MFVTFTHVWYSFNILTSIISEYYTYKYTTNYLCIIHLMDTRNMSIFLSLINRWCFKSCSDFISDICKLECLLVTHTWEWKCRFQRYRKILPVFKIEYAQAYTWLSMHIWITLMKCQQGQRLLTTPESLSISKWCISSSNLFRKSS